MIKAIIFDFDGVILESADTKTEGFRELFSNYPEKIEEIVRYHLANEGISRFVKFRYIYEQILCEKLSKAKELELGKELSRLVLPKVLKAPFVAGAKEFLNANKDRYQFFVASGTPEEELRSVISLKGLTHYFNGVFGSSKKKPEIVADILKDNKIGRDEVVFVGDSESDRIAAEKSGICFVQRKAGSNSGQNNSHYIVKDLSGLEKILNEIK